MNFAELDLGQKRYAYMRPMSSDVAASVYGISGINKVYDVFVLADDEGQALALSPNASQVVAYAWEYGYEIKTVH